MEEKSSKQRMEKKSTQHKVAVHPPYFQMIKDAITALSEKNGSSPYAIAKHIEAKHKSVLPANFRKILSLQLKNSVAKGKLMKIKASYKLSQTRKKGTVAAAKAAITRSVRANAVKGEETVEKRRRSSRSKSINQMYVKEKGKAVGGRKSSKLKQMKSIKLAVKKSKKKTVV